jgi:hypothetical protein
MGSKSVNTLTFAGVQQQSDLEKNVPMTVEQITTNKEIKDAIDIQDMMPKTADMYHGVLYTVVPVDTDLTQDITPDVQGFEKRRVLLWDDYNSLFKFDDSIWMKIAVKINKELLGNKIFKDTGDTYFIDVIPSDWVNSFKVQKTPPQYVE